MKSAIRTKALGAAALIIAAGVLIAILSTSGEHSSGFGPFAGYIWRGRVSSVRANITVPSILPASPLGTAATWIGTQAQGTGKHGPFLQIGVGEQRISSAGTGGSADSYYAFWSDTLITSTRRTSFASTPVTISPQASSWCANDGC